MINNILFSIPIVNVEVSYPLAFILCICAFVIGKIVIDKTPFLNRQFYRFVLVGAFNTFCYYTFYLILLNIINYSIAHIIAFLMAAFISYFATTMYTFKRKPEWKTFVSFPITFLPNLLMSSLGTVFLVQANLVSSKYASLIMMIAAIPITFLVNKIVFDYKAFKNKKSNNLPQ
ncbi:GtrA family protein [Mycoplasma sp. P36-A1]|uniref:GtrA family protein n=1 Tax=Mycoplasma sp. P36-A1 TaxID=3252900 RepID=UPI003C2DEF27